MKTKINHLYGNMDELDLQVCKLTLELTSEEEQEALNQGWSIYDNIWFLSRLVRCNVSTFDKIPKPIKNHTITFVEKLNNYDEIKRVFADFVKARNFKPIYDIMTDLDRSNWLLVHKNDKLVAFTKMIRYNGGIESQFTAWDYSEPKLSIGSKLVDHEMHIAKSFGYDYLYVSSGYGKVGVYKSRCYGFEWWTGTEWSVDKQSYVDLCERDEKVKTLQDLNKVFNGFAIE